MQYRYRKMMIMGKQEIQPYRHSNFLLYTAPSGKVNVDVFVQEETVCLTQNALAELLVKSEASYPSTSRTYLKPGNWTKKAMCKKCTLVALTSR